MGCPRIFRALFRRWDFKAPSATSNAEGIYCLRIEWSRLRSAYAALESPCLDRVPNTAAIRIDLLTIRRNSFRSQSKRASGPENGERECLANQHASMFGHWYLKALFGGVDESIRIHLAGTTPEGFNPAPVPCRPA